MSWHLTVNKILLSISLGKKNKRKLPIEELTTTEDKYLGKDLFRNGRNTQSHFMKLQIRDNPKSTLWVDFLNHIKVHRSPLMNFSPMSPKLV